MNTFRAFMHNNVAVLDLATGRCEFRPLPEAVQSQTLGGLATGILLAREFPGALILSAGPLTGSLVPASGQVVLTLAGVLEPSEHLSLTGRHGVALRASGLDALVITGRAGQPCSVRVADGVCAGVPGAATQLTPYVHTVPTGDVAASLAQQRACLKQQCHSASASLLLAGPAAFAGSPDAILSTEHGSVPDQGRVASYMAECNLVSICLEGGGRLPDFPLSLDNPARKIVTPSSSTSALSETLALVCPEPLASLPVQVGRPMACHHCLAPCRFWLSVQTGQTKRAGQQEGNATFWFACTNHRALHAAVLACASGDSGTSGGAGNVVDCLFACDLWGLDPERVAQVLADSPAHNMSELAHEHMRASAGTPRSSVTLATSATLAEQDIIGGLFGVCPLFLQRHPQVSAATLLACLAVPDGEARLAASLALVQ